MRKSILVLGLLFMTILYGFAQEKYFTKGGKISFDAEGEMDDLEEIKGASNTVACVLDTKTGKTEWSVLIKSFQFKNALMQEHFNENYMESKKFPKAIFKGEIQKFSSLDLKKNGEFPVTVTGKLTLHGVTKDISTKGKISVKDGKLTTTSDLTVALKNYDIKVPSVVGNKVAEVVKVTVNATLEVLK